MPKQLPVSNLFMRQLVYQNVIHLKIQIMTTIYTFAQSAIEEAQNAGRYGTANLYTSAIKSFRKFTGDRPLTFKELTPGLIKKYEESLLQKGRRHNTISAYMRMLRSIFNQAYVQGIPDATSADELFRFVFTGYEPTTKRAISPALIRRLSQLKLEQHPHLCFSRDLFLLSFTSEEFHLSTSSIFARRT